jgi:hypothetical protein
MPPTNKSPPKKKKKKEKTDKSQGIYETAASCPSAKEIHGRRL